VQEAAWHEVKIVGVLMQFNESTRGNLRRCLENMTRYCDEIAVYDDGSTDDSTDVIHEFTNNVIFGGRNDFMKETQHRSLLLSRALTLGPDYLFWLDADEVLDRDGTCGGLRKLCETGRSYGFPEITLWRSLRWCRTDYLGQGCFTRLWKNNGSLDIPIVKGLHKQLYPNGLGEILRSSHRVLHYGYATKEAIERRWDERTLLNVHVNFRRKGIDERRMKLAPVPAEWFPPGIDPPPDEPKPEPIGYQAHIMNQARL